MPLEVQSALIGAFVTVAVMSSILLRRRRRRTDVLFAVVCVILVLWFLATFLRGVYGADPWLRVETAIAALIPAGMIRLFTDLVPWTTTSGRRVMNTAYPLAGLVAVAAISPLGNFTPVTVGTVVFIAGIILAAANLMIKSSDLPKGTVEYVRRRYVAIGAAAVTFLAIAGEVPALRGTLTAIGHLSVMIYVFFLSQVILKDRLIDLNEFIGRMVILSILAVLFASISAVLVGLGNNPSTRLFNAVVGVIILLTLYEPLKIRLEAKTIELFFRERHRFVQTLEELRRRMQHGVLNPVRMGNIVTDTLYDTRRVTHVAIYMLEPMGNGFTLTTFRGPEPASKVNAKEFGTLWHAIQKNRAPLLAEQFADNDSGAESSDMMQALRAVSADVLLPFISGSSDTALGFLALRDDRSPEPYSTAELAQLMQIAETAATVIWNSQLAERLRERERLAAVGAMAAGLAHEIRNPLGSIKGAAEYLDPGRFKGDEEAEFLQVIIDESNRLNSVVSQFLDYARPFRAKFAQSDINDVIHRTAKMLEAQEEKKAVLELDLDEALPSISADSEQIKQVILNLVLNGIDASGGEPITITTRYRQERGCIELRVKDRGPGIPTEDLDRIFIPFFTTKQQGTGLGLAVCHRIVSNHGGTIYPVSRASEGTTFVILLPVSQQKSTTGSFSRLGLASQSETTQS